MHNRDFLTILERRNKTAEGQLPPMDPALHEMAVGIVAEMSHGIPARGGQMSV